MAKSDINISLGLDSTEFERQIVTYRKYGIYPKLKGTDILFGETGPVCEYLQKIPHEELMEKLRKYYYSMNMDYAETKRGSVMAARKHGYIIAFLRRKKRVPRWLRLPYLVVKHFVITKNLKLAVKLARLVLR